MQAERQLDTHLQSARLLDMQMRLGRYRRRAFAVIAVTLIASGPWLGYWMLLPLAGLFVALRIVDRVMRDTARPRRLAAIGWALSTIMIALVAALSGGPLSPACMGFALPIATLGARFSQRGVIVGVAFVVGLLLAVTLGVDPGAVTERPDRLFFPLGLVTAMAFLTGASMQSERDHRREAILDPLTGLLNRAALAQRGTQLDEQAARGEQISNGLLVGDLDHFKAINDEHGHLAGDVVLREAAAAIRDAVRAHDLVYRSGGEEFVIILPGADLSTTREVGERLRHAVAASRSRGPTVTISLGAAANADESFTKLYQRADAALYDAKRAGRNRVAAADAVRAPVHTSAPPPGPLVASTLADSPARVGPARTDGTRAPQFNG